MGGGSWSGDAFSSTTSTRASTPRTSTFKARGIDPSMDPKNMVIRESRDSAEHPNSNAVVVMFDVTGSMGGIPHFFATEGLGVLMNELLTKLPIPDPQLLVGAIGDAYSDTAPLQVGQFESDNRIDEWLTKTWLEGGGGGGNHESYGLAYYFAAKYTSIDCFEKRGNKGFLFVIGDEGVYDKLTRDELSRIFGAPVQEDIPLSLVIEEAKRAWNVFHIVVKSGSYDPETNIDTYRKYLGQNALRLDDYKALAELIITTIGVTHGMSIADATKGFKTAVTDLVLRSGVTHLPAVNATNSGEIARI